MNLPDLKPDLEHPPIGLSRLSSAANLANLTPEMLEKGIEDGVIPLELIRIGPRLKFVRSTDLAAWLAGKSTR